MESSGMSDLEQRNKVFALEDVLRNMPQVELPTSHFFANGMYARVMTLAEGVTLVGKVHKQEHFFILAKGSLAVSTGVFAQVIQAPAVIVGEPGTKRVGHALSECVCINVHKTDKIDLDEIEEELIEPDARALYDSGNIAMDKQEVLV
jgi:hypothetical protein